MEFLSDAVMRDGDAESQFVHTTGSSYMQRCCLSLYSNKSLVKHHLTVPEVRVGAVKKASGTGGGVCKLPVVGYSDTLRINKTF